MSHFYGTLQGGRGESTRCGTRSSGMTTHAAGWGGAIRVDLFERDGKDFYRVSIQPWKGSGGTNLTLVEGPLDARDPLAAVFLPDSSLGLSVPMRPNA